VEKLEWLNTVSLFRAMRLISVVSTVN